MLTGDHTTSAANASNPQRLVRSSHRPQETTFERSGGSPASPSSAAETEHEPGRSAGGHAQTGSRGRIVLSGVLAADQADPARRNPVPGQADDDVSRILEAGIAAGEHSRHRPFLLSQQPDPMATAVDTLTRATGTEPVTQAEREEASRILIRSLANGQLDQADRSYVAGRMAARMNIAQPEAEKRIDDAFARLNQAKETAKQAAERARKIGVLSAFLTAAALLVGAAAAWMAAQYGGKHRDEELDLTALLGPR